MRRLALPLLLGVPLLLWACLLLFHFRAANIFDRVLMKFPGPWAVWGAMALFPLAAAWLALRRGRRVAAAAGALLFLAFAGLVGVPLAARAFRPRTPKNPSTPREVEPPAGLPVFPGAEGFGTRTRAGRGGKMIEVTSLADDGPGTLRAALADPSPRTIVFRVGGTIELKSELHVGHPFVTVAGQTAPGDGICLKNAGLAVLTHDVLVQHLRIRPGNEGNVEPDTNDAIQILGAHGKTEGAWNVVIDHVSAGWSEDEAVSTWFGAHDVTISWSIVSEALHRSRHRKETHSAGLLVGDGSWHVTVHHTLLAHNGFRNPLFIGGGTHDFVNNVVYDWGDLGTEIVDGDSNTFLNLAGNFYKPGPSTRRELAEILINPNEGTPRIFAAGNLGPRRPDPQDDDWSIVGYGWGPERAPEKYRAQGRFAAWPVTVTDARQAFGKVLASAGATRPGRDAVDRRVVDEVRAGTGRIIDSPREVGGHPRLAGGTPPADGDHDGMPDAWEEKLGLDPRDPSDANGDSDADGYTNLEEYLHSLLR